MTKKYDVAALGELLIDFTQNGLSEQGNVIFEANPGGAPCNVLAMLSKLNKKTAFIGKVGNDQFGILLKDVLETLGIGTENLISDEKVRTTLAFVHTASDGERDFSFYRNPGADMMLSSDEINETLIQNSGIFHFGSLSMTDTMVRAATKKAIDTAKSNHCLISFDPNLRPALWHSLEEAKNQIMYGISKCDILKVSEEELAFVTGASDIESGVKILKEVFSGKLILVTMGKEGSKAFYHNLSITKEPYINPCTVDTTGAGDTFCACCLNYILEHGIDNLSEADLEQMLDFANAAASIITTKKGALRVMPTKEEVRNRMRHKRQQG